MKCSYALFCEAANINSSTKLVSIDGMFSKLKLDGPGTTTFSFLFGIAGIKKGTRGNFLLEIIAPNKKSYSGKWSSPVSDDEYEAYNAIFNCSKIPFDSEGIYLFKVNVMGSDEKKTELGRRSLKVEFNKDGEDMNDKPSE